MKKKILVIGSSNVDFTMKMERLPRTGETIGNAQFIQTFGGKGANQAVGAAKAGGDVWLVNCVGDDAFAPLLKGNLLQAGVHTEYVYEQKGVPSGAALIMVGGAGENYISVAPGANYQLTPGMVDDLRSVVSQAAMLILQCEILPETLAAAINLANELAVPVLLNLAPARPLSDEQLQKISYLVVNESEAETLCGFPVNTQESIDRACNALLAKGGKTIILTLGEDGLYAATTLLREKVPAFHVEAIDTTAAGDIFCGALAVAIVEGVPLLTACRFASAAAAICVTRLGAQTSAPTRDEIDHFLLEHQD